MVAILLVDDDDALRESLAEALVDLGHAPIPATDGQTALDILARRPVDGVLFDLRMPGLDGIEVLRRIRARGAAPPVAVITAVPTSGNTIEAMRLAAVDHLAKPVGRADLAALLARMLPDEAMADTVPPVPRKPPTDAPADDAMLIGASEAMRTVQKAIGQLADSDATVLITGETGSGKEVVARAIHRHGRRAARPFVAVNCAAIPAGLLESQLFGHARGAFTGAIADRTGCFIEANGGTLFLDEIGDMDLALQAKLLRVLETREVMPVGGRPRKVDVRILTATHRNLAMLVHQNRFREDLYWRIGVVPVVLPPLAGRLADIIPLAEHFLAGLPGGGPRRLSAEAAARLLSHAWPGNVRELRNAMDRVATLVRRDVVTAADLDFLTDAPPPVAPCPAQDLPDAVAQLERGMIRRALAEADGNRAEAARRLGIHRQLLYAKLRRYGLEASEIRAQADGEADTLVGDSGKQ